MTVHTENAPLEFPEPETVIVNGKEHRVYDIQSKERVNGNLIDVTHKMYWCAVNPQICNVSHVLLDVTDTKEKHEERIKRAKQAKWQI